MQPQPAEEPVSIPEENVLYSCTPPLTVGADWVFEIVIANVWNETLTLDSLAIVDLMDGEPVDARTWPREQLGEIGLGEYVAGPSSAMGWNDAHPWVEYFNGRQYIFTLLSEDGTEYRIIREFDMTGSAPAPEAAPMGVEERSWTFGIGVLNGTESVLTLYAIDITNLMDGEPGDVFPFEGEALANIGLGGLTLQPGEHFSWMDAHPAVDWFNGRLYRFHFKDEAGETVTYEFRFDDLSMTAPDYSGDEGKDLTYQRHDAAFEVEVAPGVYWVPAAALGGSRYSNAEVYAMLGASPEEKQANVSTLYEALQLYQVGNFTSSDDNIRLFDGAINWEHHKPGYYAVLTNTGCCATDSNWLRYILDGDYEDVGFLAYSERSASGHVYSYILQDGWYYFVDLTHFRAGDPMCGRETGELGDYYAGDFILGNIHRTQDPAAYVEYLRDSVQNLAFICMYSATDVPAVEAVAHDGGIDVIYAPENGLNVTVLHADADVRFITDMVPGEHPEW